MMRACLLKSELDLVFPLYEQEVSEVTLAMSYYMFVHCMQNFICLVGGY